MPWHDFTVALAPRGGDLSSTASSGFRLFGARGAAQSGITQKFHEKLQPSLHLHERTPAFEPRVGLDAADRADVTGRPLRRFFLLFLLLFSVSSLRFATTITFLRQAANASAASWSRSR